MITFWYFCLYCLIGFLIIFFTDFKQQSIRGRRGFTYSDYLIGVLLWPVVLICAVVFMLAVHTPDYPVFNKTVFYFDKEK